MSLRLLPLFLLFAPLLGCGDSYTFVPVQGKITLDGQPLPNAHVTFQPKRPSQDEVPGPGSVGTTNEQGIFTLRPVGASGEGAVPGQHTVRITTVPQEDNPFDDAGISKDDVPLKYQQNPPTFTVPPEGTDQANFDLGR